MKRLTKGDYTILAVVAVPIIFMVAASRGMGGLSPVHKVIMSMLLLTLVALCAAMTLSGLRYYALRLTEWVAPGRANQVSRRFAVVRATIWIGAAAVADLFLLAFTAGAEMGGAGAVAAVGEGLSVFGPMLAIVFALALHFRANSNRNLKYFLMIGAVALHSAVFLRATVRAEGAALDEQLGAAVLGPMALLVVLALAALVLASRRVAFSAHRLVHLPLWCVGALGVFPYFSIAWHPLVFGFAIFEAFLVIRFLSRAKISEHPILFFRSFANKRADAVLGRIVAPASAGFGVLRILVHERQPVSEVGALTGALDVPQLDLVPNETWKKYVRALLRICLCVILVRDGDSDGDSDGLKWEFDESLATVGASGLIVLSSEAVAPSFGNASERPAFLHLNLDDHSEVKKTRAALADWLRSTVGTCVAALHVRGAPSPSGTSAQAVSAIR